MSAALLKRIDNEMAECAQSALARPANRTEFGYGQMCGMYAGMNRIREIVLQLADEEDAKEF